MKAEPKPAIFAVGDIFAGAERNILLQCSWLKDHHKCFKLVLFYDRELSTKAKGIGINPIILPDFGKLDFRIPGFFIKVLKRENLNIVHAHGYRAMVTAAFARGFADFGVVRTIHGLPEISRLTRLQSAKRRLYKGLEDHAATFSNARECFVTDDLMKHSRKQNVASAQRVIYNGLGPIEKPTIRPRELGSEHFNIGIVGRLTPVKGIDYAIMAMSLLKEFSNIKLFVIGSGPLEHQLVELTKTLGLSKSVIFLGYKDEIYPYLAHLDTMVMSSLHEGLPYAILEALALEVPIVASKVGGLDEILTHESTALLAPVGDHEALGHCIKRLYLDNKLRNKIKNEGSKLFHKKFSLDQMGQLYWQEYVEALPW